MTTNGSVDVVEDTDGFSLTIGSVSVFDPDAGSAQSFDGVSATSDISIATENLNLTLQASGGDVITTGDNSTITLTAGQSGSEADLTIRSSVTSDGGAITLNAPATSS